MYGFVINVNLSPTTQNYYFSTGIAGRHFTFGYQCQDLYDMQFPAGVIPVHLKSKQRNVYLTIPTTFKMKTNPFGNFTIVGEVGLEHGICVSAKSSDEAKPLTGDQTQKFTRVPRYKQTAVFREALVIKAGFEYTIKDNTKASAALSYNYGFLNIFRRSYKNQYYAPELERVNREPVKVFAHCIELQMGFIF
jgi:hypothetical protein